MVGKEKNKTIIKRRGVQYLVFKATLNRGKLGSFVFVTPIQKFFTALYYLTNFALKSGGGGVKFVSYFMQKEKVSIYKKTYFN